MVPRENDIVFAVCMWYKSGRHNVLDVRPHTHNQYTLINARARHKEALIQSTIFLSRAHTHILEQSERATQTVSCVAYAAVINPEPPE